MSIKFKTEKCFKCSQNGLWSLRGLSINQRSESGRFIYLTVTKEFVLNHYIFWNIGSQMKYQNRKRKERKIPWPDILMQRNNKNRKGKSYISRDSQREATTTKSHFTVVACFSNWLAVNVLQQLCLLKRTNLQVEMWHSSTVQRNDYWLTTLFFLEYLDST